RDLPARAGGRLVTVVLPSGEQEAAGAAARLAGAVTGAPVVLAVGGPRADAWDRVLVGCDLVAVHASDDALADLAVTRLTEQRAADLGALAGARAMRELYGRLFVPAVVGGRPNPLHVDRAAYLAAGRRAAVAVARANGAQVVRVSFPHADPVAPVVIRVAVA